MRRASSVARLYAPLAVLLLSSITAGGAQTVHAAGTTVIVANTVLFNNNGYAGVKLGKNTIVP